MRTHPPRLILFPEPGIISLGVLVEDKKTGFKMLTQEYNKSSDTYHCTSQDGTIYLGDLVIIKEK
ncbi:hypothetical protein [Dysgonomonas reticulitermitis]